MRLGQIRKLIREYDAAYYLRINTYGEHERVTSIKKFLQIFVEGDDYPLSLEDQFGLAKLISPMKNDLPLVQNIKNEFTSTAEFFELFSFLQLRDIKDNTLEQVLKISPVYYTKLLALLVDLEKNNLLDEESVQKLFLMIRKKVAKPEEEHFAIKQFEDGGIPVTEYKNEKGDVQIFVKQKLEEQKLEGGRGAVFNGAKSLNDNSSQYMIKILKEIPVAKISEQDSFMVRRDKSMLTGITAKEAVRETRYARFLGRESHFFQNDNRWYVISEWQTGDAPHTISPKTLMSIPIYNRLISLSYLLKELSLLHDNFTVHGDIKFQNCVYDPHLNKLKLIDFGSTRRVKPRNHSIAFTQGYLDKEIGLGWVGANYKVNFSFCDDMYALGIVIALFFPDLYTVRQGENNLQVGLHKSVSALTMEEKAVYYLVSSMLRQDRKARCTCKDALNFCNALLENFDQADKNHLEKIYHQTLDKKEYTFDDIVHDHSPSV